MIEDKLEGALKMRFQAIPETRRRTKSSHKGSPGKETGMSDSSSRDTLEIKRSIFKKLSARMRKEFGMSIPGHSDSGACDDLDTKARKDFPKPTRTDIRLAGQPPTLYGNHYDWLKSSWYSHP